MYITIIIQSKVLNFTFVLNIESEENIEWCHMILLGNITWVLEYFSEHTCVDLESVNLTKLRSESHESTVFCKWNVSSQLGNDKMLDDHDNLSSQTMFVSLTWVKCSFITCPTPSVSSSLCNGTFSSAFSFSIFCSFSLRNWSLGATFPLAPWPFSWGFFLEFCLIISSSEGPIMQRTVGNRMRPWKRPNMQIMKNILKKDMATWDLAVTRRDMASRVEKPPLSTAGAMFSIMYSTFSSEISTFRTIRIVKIIMHKKC